MTPNHKTDTLEGLIERWRWAASLGKVTKDPAIAAQQAGWAQCADELAPILAGLRELSRQWRASRAHTYASENADHYRGFDAGQLRAAEALDAKLGQPATGDSHGK